MNDYCLNIENLSKRDQQMMYEKVSELTRESMYKQESHKEEEWNSSHG